MTEMILNTPGAETVQEDEAAESFICEIEFVKSRVIMLSSCDELNKERSKDIQYKSCGQIDQDDELTNGTGSEITKVAVPSVEQIGPTKTRRFRRISLPQWLHKSNKKSTRDELRSRCVNGSRKRRMMRTNSAPKTLGTDARNGDKKALKEEFRLATERLHLQGKTERNAGRTRVSRRISLPAVSLDHEVPRLEDQGPPFTSNQPRKNSVPLVGGLENLSRSLLLSQIASVTSTALKGEYISITGETLEGPADHKSEENQRLNKTRASSFSAIQEGSLVRDINSSATQNRLIPSPKLHRFQKPDLFFIPLPEYDVEKVSNVMCRARRVEPSVNQHQEAIYAMIEYQLQSYLRERVFLARRSQQWCLDLSQAIKVRVQNLREDYKVVCIVYIAAIRGHGFHASVNCTWSPKDDNFIVASYKNHSLFAIASVLALKYS